MSTATMKIRVLVADDHPVVRRGLRAFLETQDDLEVVAEVGDGTAAVEAARALQPDVALLDLLMPHGGADGIAAMREACPRTRVIVLTSCEARAPVLAAMRAGALSFLLKDSAPELLHTTIQAAARDEACIHPRIAAMLASDRRERAARPDLSAREQDVLEQLAAGASNAEIALRLGIGIKTVKTHVSNLLAKLAVEDRTQAAVLALREGLVQQPPKL